MQWAAQDLPGEAADTGTARPEISLWFSPWRHQLGLNSKAVEGGNSKWLCSTALKEGGKGFRHMQGKGCVSPALVISIMETQHFTAFNLYVAEVNYQHSLKFCFHFSTWNANSSLGNVNSTFSLKPQGRCRVEKAAQGRKLRSGITHTRWSPPARPLARKVIFKTVELRESVRESQEVQTILLAAGGTIKRN